MTVSYDPAITQDLQRWVTQEDVDEYLDALGLPWCQKRALKTLGYSKRIKVEWDANRNCWVWHEAKLLPIGEFESEYVADGVVRSSV